MDFDKVDCKTAAQFHGHVCSGFFIGYRVAQLATSEAGVQTKNSL